MMVLIDNVNPDAIGSLLAAVRSSDPSAIVRLFEGTTEDRKPDRNPDIVSVAAEAVLQLLQSCIQNNNVIRKVLSGKYNSWEISFGDSFASPRWATSAIAKSLRRYMPSAMLCGFDSPLDLLLVRKRTYFPDGSYQGISYRQTAIGEAVFTAVYKDK
jgi:hypothetical protein